MGVYLKNAHILVDNSPQLTIALDYTKLCSILMPRDCLLTKLYDVRFL